MSNSAWAPVVVQDYLQSLIQLRDSIHTDLKSSTDFEELTDHINIIEKLLTSPDMKKVWTNSQVDEDPIIFCINVIEIYSKPSAFDLSSKSKRNELVSAIHDTINKLSKLLAAASLNSPIHNVEYYPATYGDIDTTIKARPHSIEGLRRAISTEKVFAAIKEKATESLLEPLVFSSVGDEKVLFFQRELSRYMRQSFGSPYHTLVAYVTSAIFDCTISTEQVKVNTNKVLNSDGTVKT